MNLLNLVKQDNKDLVIEKKKKICFGFLHFTCLGINFEEQPVGQVGGCGGCGGCIGTTDAKG